MLVIFETLVQSYKRGVIKDEWIEKRIKKINERNEKKKKMAVKIDNLISSKNKYIEKHFGNI